MLARNAQAITWWGDIDERLGLKFGWTDLFLTHVYNSNSPYTQLKRHLNRNLTSPITYNNGIWDLVSANFPNHNVIPMSVDLGVDHRFVIMPLSCKGERKMIFTGSNREASPIIPGVTNTTISFNPDNGICQVFPLFDTILTYAQIEIQDPNTVKIFYDRIRNDPVGFFKK